MAMKLWRNVQNAIDEACLRYTIEHPEAAESEREKTMAQLVSAGEKFQREQLGEILKAASPYFN